MKPNALVFLLAVGLSGAAAGELSSAPNDLPRVAEESDAGRSRLGLRLGLRQRGANGFRINGWEVGGNSPREHGSFGLDYSRWFTRGLAVTLTATAQASEIEVSYDARRGDSKVKSHGIVSVLLGVRKSVGGSGAARPYVVASAGPYFGTASVEKPGPGAVSLGAGTIWSLGGHAGVGVDYRLGRSCVLDLGVGYNLVSDFSNPVGGRLNYSGLELSVGISWLFGGDDTRAR